MFKFIKNLFPKKETNKKRYTVKLVYGEHKFKVTVESATALEAIREAKIKVINKFDAIEVREESAVEDYLEKGSFDFINAKDFFSHFDEDFFSHFEKFKKKK